MRSGFAPGNTMSLVILPQALRVMIPPMISQYLNLTKNSSLALLVGYMDATGTLGGITLNQTGREFETLFLLMAFYLAVSLSIAAVMNLYNENVKLVERTSTSGLGFSFLSVIDGLTGRWENLKRGDAIMKPGYGIRGFINLFVLFYVGWLLLLMNYTFLERISDIRPSYFEWTVAEQLTMLLSIIMCFGAVSTCLFKNARFFDFVVVELIAFVLLAFFGRPLIDMELAFFGEGSLLATLDATTLFAIGVGIRVAILIYTAFGPAPNLTFFNRVREA